MDPQIAALYSQIVAAAETAGRRVCTEAEFRKFAGRSAMYRRLAAAGPVGVRLKRPAGPYMVHNLVFVRASTVAEPVQQEFPDDQKRCPKCREVKPKTEFYTSHPNTRGGLQSWCKPCARARARQSYQDRKKRRATNAAA